MKQIARNDEGIYVCPHCKHDEFIQEVTATNTVAFHTSYCGHFIESDDYVCSWEAESRGPLRCDGCGKVVRPPDEGDTDARS